MKRSWGGWVRHPSTRCVWAGLILAVFVQSSATAAGAGAPPSPPPAAPGDQVAAFEAQAVDGTTRHVAFTKGSTTVLLFFLSSCPTCHRMIPLWNQAYERRPAGVTVVGVLLDQEPPGFFAATRVSFPVVRSPGKEFLAGFKVSKVPVTMRVIGPGRVEDVSVGAVDAMRVGELFRR